MAVKNGNGSRVIRLPWAMALALASILLGAGGTWATMGRNVGENTTTLAACRNDVTINTRAISQVRADMSLADQDLRGQLKNATDVTNVRLLAIEKALIEIKAAIK